MARTAAPAAPDPRQFVRVAVDLPLNPKLAAIDDPAAGWTYVVSLCYSGQSLTDGHIPVRAVLRLAGTGQDVANALVEQGLWHLPGHTCDRCEQPKPGHAIVHDYLEHQRSAAEARELSSKRSEAGRKGAQARWGTPDGSDMANAMASAMANGSQTDGKPMAEERRGEERTTNPPTPQGGKARRSAPTDYDSDPNFGRFWDMYPLKTGKPAALKAWRAAMKRKADPEQIIAAARRYRTDPRRKPEYTKHPGPWLNDERYNDQQPALQVVNGNGGWWNN